MSDTIDDFDGYCADAQSSVMGFEKLCRYATHLQTTLTPDRPEWNGKPDARRLALGNIARPVLSGACVLLRILANSAKHESAFALLTGFERGSWMLRAAHEDVARAAMTSCLTSFQFQVEHLFQNLWAALGNKDGPPFQELATKLLTELGLSSASRLDRIKALAFLRNSLHNNGIHRKEDLAFDASIEIQMPDGPFELHGMIYFKKLETLSCPPTTLLALLAGVLEIVREVLESKRIKEQAGPIPDLRG